MAYIITEPCKNTKDTACVEVCPVDCIHPTKDNDQYSKQDQLFIDPETCIDCGACQSVCPVTAIYPEDQLPEDQKKYIKINADYFSN